MKKYGNIITIGAVALLLGAMLIPSIGAMSLDGKTVKTTIEKEDKMTEKFEDKECTSNCFGSICGYIEYYYQPWTIPIPVAFALVDVGIKNTFSNGVGYYELTNLPINRSYTITVTARSFESQSVNIDLTSEQPNKIINFNLVLSKHGIGSQTQVGIHDSNLYISKIFDRTQNTMNIYEIVYYYRQSK